MAFVHSKEFNPESLSTDSVLKPNKSLVCKRPHHRLVSTRERVLKKKENTKNLPLLSFIWQNTHRSTKAAYLGLCYGQFVIILIRPAKAQNLAWSYNAVLLHIKIKIFSTESTCNPHNILHYIHYSLLGVQGLKSLSCFFDRQCS